MSKVIRIRGLPDDVHDALIESARAKGLSLTQYMLGQLEHLARLPQIARDNRATIRSTQKRVQDPVDRNTILSVLNEGRGE